MIPTVTQILLILIFLIALGRYALDLKAGWAKGERRILALKAPSLITRSKAKKEDNKKRILGLFDSAPEGKLTSFDVQVLLDVSDATALRYMEELQKEGKIRPAGGIGRHVYYEKVV